ncbi:MAG TPA: DolP-mannose mannosyltransferase [Blastocatellia bacterium]|nr:DolP-mannose mannosyltransferase [Blastocatellia bacterium]
MPSPVIDSSALPVPLSQRLNSLGAQLTTRRIAICALVLGCVLASACSPFSQSESGDNAIYDYLAQSILRGQMPYRDAVEMKSPGSVYISAFAMLAGRLLGLSDVMAVRWLYILLTGLFSLILYLVAEVYLRNRWGAIIAFLFPLMVTRIPAMFNGGTQPKLPMMIFALLSILCIQRDRPFMAGVWSMLSCICWQPGLLFTGTAFLIFSKYLTSWRDLRAVRVLAGAILPLGVLLLYFYLRGALADLWSWTIVFNYSVFAPESQRSLSEAAGKIWTVSNRIFGIYMPFVVVGLIGFIVALTQGLRSRLVRRDITELHRDAIIIPFVVYLLFCLVNFQSGPDLIPFFPFLGLFIGLFVLEVVRFMSAKQPLRGSLAGAFEWAPPAVCALMLLGALVRGAFYKVDSPTLQTQEQAVAQIGSLIGPQDKIYVHGTVEVLVLLNRANINPYIALDGGADLFIASRKAGGFDDVINEIESEKPRLVCISRLQNVRKRAELERWVQDHYDRVPMIVYDRVYLRKPE